MSYEPEMLDWVKENSALGHTGGKCPKCKGTKFYIHAEYTVAKVTKVGKKLEIKGMDREANDTEVYTVDCAGIGCDWSEIIME